MPASPGLSERPCFWSSSVADVRVRSGGRPRRWPCARSLRARYAPSRGARAWTATGSACASSWSSCSRGVRARAPPGGAAEHARSRAQPACFPPEGGRLVSCTMCFIKVSARGGGARAPVGGAAERIRSRAQLACSPPHASCAVRCCLGQARPRGSLMWQLLWLFNASGNADCSRCCCAPQPPTPGAAGAQA